MSTVEYVCIFVRAAGERLQAAERHLLSIPQLVGGALVDCDLRYRASSKFLGFTLRLHGESLNQPKRDRLAFWTARAGGRAADLAGVSREDREKIEAHLGAPSHERARIPAAELFDASGRFFADAGASASRRRAAVERPVLSMDVGGPGWEGVRYAPAEKHLFVGAPISPPVGDEISLAIRVPGTELPVEARATVVGVRTPAAASPGFAAGYTLRLEGPPAVLEEALASQAAAGGGQADSRAAPRFQVNAPVKVIAVPPPLPEPPEPRAAPAPVPAPTPAPGSAKPGSVAHARIEYATDQELAADFIENLSQGGAFIRTQAPPPVGTPVELQLNLPNGTELRARAMVAFVNSHGMGVRFQLDPEAEAVLNAAMAHFSARPRRALVVDDDELVRRMLADALRDRGFEVLTAADAKEGLSTLSEELLALDLLLTDVVMPGMSGEDLVRLIRRTGGELELAIVAVTGHLQDGLEPRLEAAGADAVLDKALGPDLIAQAADAVLERKRLVSQGR
jgi:uncharacterized protein (TIGR02266 family)